MVGEGSGRGYQKDAVKECREYDATSTIVFVNDKK
jgi:hypothetical protein